MELKLEIKRQFEIRRANIQNIIKENEELQKNSKVRAAASTIKKVNGLQLSVWIYVIYYRTCCNYDQLFFKFSIIKTYSS